MYNKIKGTERKRPMTDKLTLGNGNAAFATRDREIQLHFYSCIHRKTDVKLKLTIKTFFMD
jgi:hypothetical protein